MVAPNDRKENGYDASQQSVLPPVRALHGPTVRELQAAIQSLRDASLLAVEAAQAWRLEEMKSAARIRAAERKVIRDSSGTHSEVATAAVDELGGNSIRNAPSDRKGPGKSRRRNSSDDIGAATTTATSSVGSPPVGEAERFPREVRFPVVQPEEEDPVVPLETRDIGNNGLKDGNLPIFLWNPSAARNGGGGSGTLGRSEASLPHGHRLHNSCDRERVGGAVDNIVEHAAPATTGTHNGCELALIDAESDCQATRQTDASYDNTRDSDVIAATGGVNYLAGMASDTDFIGAPGSAIVDLFPPDAKLYRNPFVLGHNLDDTLVLFTATANPRRGSDGACGGRRHTESRGGRSREEPATATGQARLNTSRVRLAAAIIVAEDEKDQRMLDVYGRGGVRVIEGHDGVVLSGGGEENDNVAPSKRSHPGSALLQRSRSFNSSGPRKRKEVGISFKDDDECLEDGSEKQEDGDLPSIT